MTAAEEVEAMIANEPIVVHRTWMVDYRLSSYPALADAWVFYQDSFSEINRQAAQSHLMGRADFDNLMSDPMIGKWLAMRGGRIVGMAVMTDDLDAWPLISRLSYQRRWPGRRIFYIGFVACAPRAVHAFSVLIGRMYEEVIAADGLAAMDFSGVTVEQRRIASRTDALLRRLNPNAHGELFDRQEFWVWDFRPPEGDQDD